MRLTGRFEDYYLSDFSDLDIRRGQHLIYHKKSGINGKSFLAPVVYEGVQLGEVRGNLGQRDCQNVADHLAPIFSIGTNGERMDIAFSVFDWLLEARELATEVVDWIGVYYKASYLYGETGTDLVLGPYIGESTEHVRIPIDRGFCGTALREKRIVNVADVTVDDNHIACSLTTRSELVVPIADRAGELVAELDIDSDQLDAFDTGLERQYRELVKSFPLLS